MQGKRTNSTRSMLSKIYRHGISSLFFVVSLAILLVIINYIVSLNSPTFDVTRNKTNTLSSPTRKLLEVINFDIEIKAFYSDAYQTRIRRMLEKYANECDWLHVEYIDPIKDPLAADQYDVQQSGTIIMEGAGRQARVNPPPPGEQNDESDITIALFRLYANQEPKKLYFTIGHGENNIYDTTPLGLANIREKLEDQNYIVENISLLEYDTIPEDCTALIVCGPTVPFTDEEVAMIDNYLDQQGSIFAMVGPFANPRVNEIMFPYGIKYGDDYIYETSSRLTTEMGGPIYPFVAPTDSSEITENLRNQLFMFPLVRSLWWFSANAGFRVTPILQTSENSWTETDLASAQTANTNVKPVRNLDNPNEIKGPIFVGVTTEREFDLPDSLSTRNLQTFWVRSAFFGNAAFATNSIVSTFTPNMNLFLNTVNWVSRNEEIIDVTPNTDIFTPVELTQSKRRFISWLTLVIFPAIILLAGMVVWIRKR